MPKTIAPFSPGFFERLKASPPRHLGIAVKDGYPWQITALCFDDDRLLRPVRGVAPYTPIETKVTCQKFRELIARFDAEYNPCHNEVVAH